MQVKFPIITHLLFEDFDVKREDEVKSILSDVRSGWTSPLEVVDKQTTRSWKKLDAEQQADLQALLLAVAEKILLSPETPVNTSVFSPSSKTEAVASTMGLLNLSRGFEQLGSSFIKRCQMIYETILDEKDVDAALRGNLYELQTISVREFSKAHGKDIKRLVKISTDFPRVEVSATLSKLLAAISKTPPGKQREAIFGVFYLLSSTAVKLKDAQEKLRADFSRLKFQKPVEEA